MTISTRSIVAAFRTHLEGSGHFDSVTGHEPKNPPTGQGVTAAVWVDSLAPTEALGALNATSVVMTFLIRLYKNMTSEPQDDIDPLLMDAVDRTCLLLSGDFTLGDAATYVDLLGNSGGSGRAGARGMSVDFGYVSLGGTMYRSADITVPVVLEDVWPQAR